MVQYIIYWEGYEVGSISKSQDGWEIECYDEVLINWSDVIFQDFEKDSIFSQLNRDGFTVEYV